MITSAEEFIRLRFSDDIEEQRRSAVEEADISVWHEVLKQYPDNDEREGALTPTPYGYMNEYISENANVRDGVALNKRLPDEIIRILAKDRSWRVRCTIAWKRKTPPDVLRELADDPDDSVRNKVAWHRKTPKDVLERMLNDPWDKIVLAVKKRLGIIDNADLDPKLRVST